MRTGESNRITNGMSGLLALVLLLSFGHGALAAKVRAKILGIEMRTVQTPNFRDTSNSKAASKNEWLQFLVKYETSGGEDGWIDSISLDWTLIMKPQSGRPIVSKERVVYSDIDEGVHYAVVYVRPKFIQRHTGQKRPNRNDFGIYVEIRVDGEKMDRLAETKLRLPSDWFLRKEPDVKVVEGELLPRTKTPFAAMDYDFYEHISETSP